MSIVVAVGKAVSTEFETIIQMGNKRAFGHENDSCILIFFVISKVSWLWRVESHMNRFVLQKKILIYAH